jgi:hypothetical protein
MSEPLAVGTRKLGIDVNAGIDGFSEVVWTDLASLVVFLALLSAAVLLRRRVEWHRRFMVLTSISVVSPALSSSRLGRLIPLLRGLGPLTPGSVRFAMLLMFVAGVALYDVLTRKRFHPATLVGGASCWRFARSPGSGSLSPTLAVTGSLASNSRREYR